jgi:hypothetical protein
MNPLALFAGALSILALAQDHGKAHHVDPDLIMAIAHVESRGQADIVKHESNGSCSVGLGGINVPGCDPVVVEHLKSPDANVRAIAVILDTNRTYCKEHPDNEACKRGGAIALYNPGDKGYLKRVHAARKQIRKLAKAKRRR